MGEDQILTPMQIATASMKEVYDALRHAGFSWKEAAYIVAVSLASTDMESEKDD